tara:strand:- start:551 stop:1558 length:1008 start_codon:yes stop_codon:yes gene_type:complete
MLVKEIILEAEESGLANNIVGLLKKTPSVDSPMQQFKNDPQKIHAKARAQFREWATRQGLAYLHTNVMRRGKGNTTKIAFYTFIAMMQKECGLPVNGILNVSTMRGFVKNASKFSDSHMNSRVESAIANNGPKVPRGCIDVVKAIENRVNSWTSTYASYHDRNGVLDFGIGPGQVEPKTYGDVKGGSFDFGNLDHVASIDMLTKAMLETINLKMRFADRLANKDGADTTTLEHFARAWNYINFGKAESVYGKDIPMRKGVVTSPRPKSKTDKDAPKDVGDQPALDAAIIKMRKKEADDNAAKANAAKANPDDPSYFDQMKSGIGNMVKGYFSDKG